LPGEGAVGIGEVTQVSFQHGLGTETVENLRVRRRPI